MNPDDTGASTLSDSARNMALGALQGRDTIRPIAGGGAGGAGGADGAMGSGRDLLAMLAPVGTTDTYNAALNPVWGFDPLDLLTKTEFPNDRFEQLLRSSKDARMVSVRRLPLEILEDEESFAVYQRANDALRQASAAAAAAAASGQSGGFAFGPGGAHHGGGGHHRATSPFGGGRLTPSSWSTTAGPSRLSMDGGPSTTSTHWRRGSKAPMPIVIPSVQSGGQPPPQQYESMSRRASMSQVGPAKPGAGLGTPPRSRLSSYMSRHGGPSGAATSHLTIDGPGRVYPDMQNLFEMSQAGLTPVEQIRRSQLARSAAALLIQSCFRGWRTRRKFISIVHAKMSILTHGDSLKSLAGLPGVDDLSVQEKLWRRYLRYSMTFERRGQVPPTYIQANWRCFVVRRAWLEIQAMSDEQSKSKSGLEARIRLVRHAHKPRAGDTIYEQSAQCIQRIWRRYYNTRIYRFYRDLVKFGEQGDPKRLLMYINPKEAQLIDESMGAHVRFRLGGTTFPPVICYKIFVHRPLIDMNAFSKQLLPKQRFLKDYSIPVKKAAGRPLQIKWNRNYTDIHSIITPAPQTKPFHHSKLKRHEDVLRQRRQRKLMWLKQLYRQGLELVHPPTTNHLPDSPSKLWLGVTHGLELEPYRFMDMVYSPRHPAATDTVDLDASGNALTSGGGGGRLDDSMNDGRRRPRTVTPAHSVSTDSRYEIVYRMQDADSEGEIHALAAELDAEFDPDFLIRWTRALDFDEYQHQWMMLATTGGSDATPPDMQVAGLALDHTRNHEQQQQPSQPDASQSLADRLFNTIHADLVHQDAIERVNDTAAAAAAGQLPPYQPSHPLADHRGGDGGSGGGGGGMADPWIAEIQLMREMESKTNGDTLVRQIPLMAVPALPSKPTSASTSASASAAGKLLVAPRRPRPASGKSDTSDRSVGGMFLSDQDAIDRF
ncbi:hypothetical protein BC831DRAFT_455080 [Entophlyctis helioformis]|nr:hypothetical protein BC831DRAFT_455080 [Entophlyctis helioformis]